jgi:D-glycero-D-manno-heptose 1,7-bisphosphate phosphatase
MNLPDRRAAYTTLFLDRDGVINRRLPGRYVQEWSEFYFLPGVPDTIASLCTHFDRVVVVTNQQGIGKGLMSAEDLHAVHHQMIAAVEKEGGRIDGVYFCPDLASEPDNCRKPAPVMGHRARRDFPDIDFDHSVMVGDSLSDMVFGKELGMFTVLITTKEEEAGDVASAKKVIDVQFPSLEAFGNWWSASF